MKKKLYKLFPFIPKMNLKIGRYLASMKVKLSRGKVEEKLRLQNDIYANIGCGDTGLSSGWVNIDIAQYVNVTYTYDCTRSLPFADNSVKGLYTEHFFEHLDYSDDVPFFLSHAHRSLQENGVLRIVIPDGEKYLIGYVQPGWEYLKKTRPLDNDLHDLLMGVKYKTKMQLVNEVFRQGGAHKYAWDFETLALCLKNAGFKKVSKMSYLNSKDKKLEIDQLIREPESLYVDAIK